MKWLIQPLGVRGFAALLTFVAALCLCVWVFPAVSMALFRIDPAKVPEGFDFVYYTRDTGYDVGSWKQYRDERGKLDVPSFRLPDVACELRGKATYTFRVLKDDGRRQLIEVEFEGPYQSWSRYEAYPDRVVPVAYYSVGERGDLPRFGLMMLIAGLAAFAAAVGVGRLEQAAQT